MEWVRLLLSGNPFYLISAALLLFGLNRLVVDPDFLGAADPKLIFTFSSLEIYEVLLVSVAILLARRKVWYDSTLLLVMESALLLVPFILMVDAVLTGRWLALVFCVAGTGMAMLRFGALRRFIREWNMPRDWLICGTIVLLANLALPFVFRPIMELDVQDWEGPSHLVWLVILPLLQFMACLPPQLRDTGVLPMQRRWLPLMMYTLWIIASAVHLWCVGYVCNLKLFAWMLAPVLVSAAWVGIRRLDEFVPAQFAATRGCVMALPALLAALALEREFVFLSLVLLNSVLYALLLFLGRERSTASILLQVSLISLALGVPSNWLGWAVPGASRGMILVAGCCLWAWLRMLLSPKPLSGILGALMIAIGPFFVIELPNPHLPLQIAASVLFLHSLRWQRHAVLAYRWPLWGACAVWGVDSLLWTARGGSEAAMTVMGEAIVVLACAWLVRLVTGRWDSWLPIVAAGLAFSAAPLNWTLSSLWAAHPGVLALVWSFLLFGVGTVMALTKHRWHVPSPPHEPNNPQTTG